MIIVSACLAGINCRYNAKEKGNPEIIKLIKEKKAIPLCAEQLGGLCTPRLPVDVISGKDVLEGREKIVNEAGVNVTDNFIRGAEEVLKVAKLIDPELIIFKSRSPSCGEHGVATALLRDNNFKVIDDEKWLERKNSRQ